MKHFAIILFLILSLSGADARAQRTTPPPLYIVNGRPMSEEQVKAIDPKDIVEDRMLMLDEQVIEQYGPEASNGVVIITLRYDTPARFVVEGEEQSYSAYIAERIKWSELDGVARVVVRFTLDNQGGIASTDILEATDKRLLRRVEKAMAEAPRWQPALKDGRGVSTEHLLRITLPRGREVPREPVVRIRG